MFCKNCGQPMQDNQAVCLGCGVKKGTGNRFCYNCGKELPVNADVCLNCGVAAEKKDLDTLGGKDKVVIAVICFFFGALGIHNFMMGEIKKGITRIVASLCCGIGSIIAIIDLIKILMDRYEVDTDKLF